MNFDNKNRSKQNFKKLNYICLFMVFVMAITSLIVFSGAWTKKSASISGDINFSQGIKANVKNLSVTNEEFGDYANLNILVSQYFDGTNLNDYSTAKILSPSNFNAVSANQYFTILNPSITPKADSLSYFLRSKWIITVNGEELDESEWLSKANIESMPKFAHEKWQKGSDKYYYNVSNNILNGKESLNINNTEEVIFFDEEEEGLQIKIANSSEYNNAVVKNMNAFGIELRIEVVEAIGGYIDENDWQPTTGLIEAKNIQDYNYYIDDEDNLFLVNYLGNLKEFKVPSSFNLSAEEYNAGRIEYKKLKKEEIGDIYITSGKKLKVKGIGKQTEEFYLESFSRNAQVIELAEGIEIINNYAFNNSFYLRRLQLPGTIKEIGKSVFENCKSLKEITLSNNSNFVYENYTLLNSTKTEIIFHSPASNLEYYTLDKTVTNIRESAFYGNTTIKSIDLKEINTIGKKAFYGCKNLSQLVIPSTTTNIGKQALDNCNNLVLIDVKTNKLEKDYKLPIIEKKNWYKNGYLLVENTINKDSSIGIYSTKITDEESVGTIEEWEYIIEDEKVWITGYRGSSTETLIVPSLLRNPVGEVLEVYGVKSINGNSIVANDKGVSNLSLGLGIVEIGESAFKSLTTITSVSFTKTITKIDRNAFNGCTQLTAIDTSYLSNLIEIRESAFEGCINANILLISDNVKTIGNRAFANCENISNTINLSASNIETIGEYVFENCKNLTEILFPTKLKVIEKYTFKGCTSLPEVELLNTIIEIKEGAFEDCTSLIKINIGELNLTEFSDRLFYNCTSLTKESFDFPTSLQTIGKLVFANCISIEQFIIPNYISNIGIGIFKNCNNIISLKIPFIGINRSDINTNTSNLGYLFGVENSEITSSLKYIVINRNCIISNNAFVNAKNIEEIEFTYEITKLNILDEAFNGCSNLKLIKTLDYETTKGLLFDSTHTKLIRCPENYNGMENISESELVSNINELGKYAFNNVKIEVKTLTFNNSLVFEENSNIFDNFASLEIIEIKKDTLNEYNLKKVANVNWHYIQNVEGDIFKNIYAFKAKGIYYKNLYQILGDEYKEWDFERVDRKIKLIEYLGKDSLVTAPSAYSIERRENVVLPDVVETINLGNITNSIGESVFEDCKELLKVNFESMPIIIIPNYAFKNCSKLTTITIPNTLITIGNNVFANCNSLTELTIPTNIESIGTEILKDCTSLQTLTVPFIGSSRTDNETRTSVLGYFFGESTTGVTQQYSVNGTAIYGIPSRLKKITVNDANIIPYGAFSNCSNLTSIIFINTDGTANSLVEIKERVLYNCTGLREFTFVDTITTVQEGMFEGCSSLTTINNLENTQITTIPNKFFKDCTSLTTFTLPSTTLTTIGNNVFENCNSLTKITIPTSVEDIGTEILKGCTRLYSLIVPFIGSSRTDNETRTSVLGYFFGEGEQGTSYTYSYTKNGKTINVEIPVVEQEYASGSVAYYFIPSSLKAITVNDANFIPYGAFSNCSNLTSITLSNTIGTTNSLTTINDKVLQGCTGLREFTFVDTITTVQEGMFEGCSSLTTVKKLEDIQITNLPNNFFKDCTSLTTFALPSTLTTIGNNVFENCNSLTELTIPTNVETIGTEILKGCTSLQNLIVPFIGSSRTDNETRTSVLGYFFGESTTGVTQQYSANGTAIYGIPSSLTTITVNDANFIQYGAFSNCSNLTSIIFINTDGTANSLVEIKERVLYNCTGLREFTFVETITTVQEGMFEGCSSLITIYNLQNLNLTTIPNNFFKDCTSLTTLTLPSTLTTIGNNVFENCSSLTELTIPTSVETIGTEILKGCTSLQTLTVPFIGRSRTDNETRTSVLGYFFGEGEQGTSYTYSYTKNGETINVEIPVVEQEYANESVAYYFIPVKLNKLVVTNQEFISYGAFSNLNLFTSISTNLNNISDNIILLLNDIVSLGDNIIKGSKITNIYLGNNIVSVTDKTFNSSRYLSKIEVSENSLYYSSDGVSLYNKNKTTLVRCPERFNFIENKYVILSTTVNISNNAFLDCLYLGTLTIPARVETIGTNILKGCTSLQTLTVPFIGSNRTDNETRTSVLGYFFGEGEQGTSYTYSYTKNGETINVEIPVVEQEYASGNVAYYFIPSSLTTITVNDANFIPYGAFSNCVNLTSIIFTNNFYVTTNSLVEVKERVLYNCTGLREFTFVDTITTVQEGMFEGCSSLTTVKKLEDIQITNLPNNFFKDCTSLTTFALPSTLTTIGNNVFENCNSLTELTIPTSVETIGTEILKGCTSLQTLTVPFIGRNRTDNETRTSVLGYFFGESTTGVTQQYSANGTAIYGIPSSLTTITVNDANFIQYGAFSNCSNLTSIIFINTDGTANSLVEIKERVLYNCTGLEEFTFVKTITTVQEGMFEGCSSLITIYNLQNLNLTNLPNNFFKDCTSLRTFTLPSTTLTTIGNNVFENCYSLPNIVLPTSIQTIGDYVFLNCNSITNLTIPTSVETIGIGILKGCSNLQTLTVPFIGRNRTDNETRTSVLGYFFGEGEQGTRYIYSYTKNGETINVEIPVVEQEYAIGNVAYYFIPSSLTTITVNDANFIPYGAFSNCNNLISVTFINTDGTANSLVEIKERVLYNCTGLEEFTFVETITTVQEGMFEGCSSLVTIYNLQNLNLTKLPNNFFKDCTSLTTFTLPSTTLTTIGNNVFENCSSLTELTIPTSVETIGTEMLKGCTSLQTLTVPFIGRSRTDNNNTKTSVLGYFFGESTTGVTQQYSANGTATYGIPSSLTTITVNDSNFIQYGAFSNCSNLTSIIFINTDGTANSLVEIKERVLYNCTGLEEFTFVETITTVQEGMFEGCSSLRAVNNLENTQITTIPNKFFKDCTSLRTLTLPNILTTVGNNVFENCYSLPNIVLPTSIQTIGDYVFLNCNSITNLTIPTSVKTIGIGILKGCSNLQTLTVPFIGSNRIDNETRTSVLGYFFGEGEQGTSYTYSYTKNGKTINVEIPVVEQEYASGNVAYYFIPSSLTTITVNDANFIPYGAFSNCVNLTSIIFINTDGTANSLVEIKERVLYNCTGLKKFTFVETITTVQEGMFEGCSSLVRISNLQNLNLTNLPNNFFKDCTSLTTFTLPSTTLTTIGNNVFENCSSLTELTIPTSVETIGTEILKGCTSLQTLTVPFIGRNRTDNETRTSVLGYFFGEGEQGTSYTYSYTKNGKTINVEIPVVEQEYASGSVAYYFIPSSLKAITVNDANFIQYGAFSNCVNLTSITLSDTTGTIGNKVFENCSSLGYLTIPTSVETIGTEILKGCSELYRLTVPFIGSNRTDNETRTSVLGYFFGEGEQGTSYTYSYTKNGETINVEIPVVEQEYASGNVAYYFIPSSLTTITVNDAKFIPYGAFSNCVNLTSITLSNKTGTTNTLTTINDKVLQGCTGLREFTFVKTITTVQEGMFEGCSSLTTINNLENIQITNLPNNFFKDCTSLTTFTLPSTTLTTIGNNVFKNCSSMKTIIIPKSVRGVGESVFEGCSSLTTVNNLENTQISTIPNKFFKDCTSLTTFTLPNTLTTVGNNVFENCYSLSNIVLPTSIQTIGDYVFLNCNSITNLTIPTSVKTIGIGILKGCSNLQTLTVPFIGSNRIDNETRTSVLGYFFGEGEQGTSYIYSYTKNGETINVEIPVVEQEYASGNVAYYFIPSSLTTITVNDANFIQYGAFSNCSNLTSIIFINTDGTANSLVEIKERVLYNCTGLREFTFVETITTVQEGMFEGCSLLVTIYNLQNLNLTKLPNNFFKDCTSLTTLTLPSTLTTIGNNVFENCSSLTELTIPTSVETIGTDILKGCSSLQTLIIPFIGRSRTDNETRTSVLGYFFGEGEQGTSYTYSYTKNGKTINVEIPVVEQEYASGSVAYYFIPSSLKAITVNDANFIQYGAFSNCVNLTSITLSDTTGTIGNKVFENCSSLGYLTIPTSVETIGTEILKGCSELYRLTVPFIGSNRTDNETRTSVLGYFFGEGEQGTSYTYSYTKNGETINVEIPVVEQEYASGNVAYYFIPSSLTTITVNDAKFIPYGAFSNCVNLTSITLSNKTGTTNTLTTINDKVLQGCTGLREFTFVKTITTVQEGMFEGCSSLTTINNLENIQITNLPNNFFKDCTSLTTFTLPSTTLTTIGNNVFKNCSSMKTIIIPKSVRGVGESVFEGCSSLTTVNNLENTQISTIPNKFFKDCTSLTTFTLPSTTLTTIGNNVFENCSSLTELTIPTSVETIGIGILKGCSNLQTLTVPFIGSNRTDNETRTSVLGYFFGEGEQGTRYTYSYTKNGETINVEIPVVEQEYANESVAYYFISANLTILNITNQDVIPYGAFSGLNNFYSLGDNYDYSTRTRLTKNYINITGENSISFSDNLIKNSSIRSVWLSEKIINVTEKTFNNCNELKAIAVSSSNTIYSNDEYYILFNKNKTILLKCPEGLTTNNNFYNIKDTVTEIGGYAFYKSKIIKYFILDTNNIFTKINPHAFDGIIGFEYIQIGGSGNLVNNYDLTGLCAEFGYTIYQDGGKLTSGNERIFEKDAIYSTYPLGLTKHWRYIEESGKNWLIEYIGSYTEVSIPSKLINENGKIINIYGIKNPEKSVFNNDITSITIGEISEIGQNVFTNTKIETIIIPKTINKITPGVFDNITTLKTIYVEQGNANYISDEYGVLYTINYENLFKYPEGNISTTYEININTIKILDNAFSNNSFIKEITINTSLQEVEGEYFYNLNSLEKFICSEENTNYSVDNFILYTKDYTSLIKVPENYQNNSLTLHNLTTSIKKNAIRNIEKVNRIDILNVLNIEDNSILNLPNIIYIKNNKDLTNNYNLNLIKNTDWYYESFLLNVDERFISVNGFYSTSNLSTDSEWSYFNDGNKNWIYRYNGTKEIISVPKSLINIESGEIIEIYGLSAKNIDGNYISVFNYKQKVINLNNSLKEIGSYTFKDCSNLQSINFIKNNNIIKIDSYAFMNCTQLKNLVNFNYTKISNLNENCFLNCTSLTTLTLPSTLTTIGNKVFENCSSLGYLTIPTSVETIGTEMLKGCTSLQTLTVPFIGSNRTDNETRTSVLGYFFGESTTGVTQQYSVNGTAIYGIPSSLKAITVNDANFIPYGAFSNCSNLTSITLSNTTGTTNTLTTINDKVLQGCTGLREFTFVETITTVQEGMFEGCSLLVTIYNLQNLNLTKLPNNFFKDCTSLTTLTLPSTLTTIGNNVFENCSSLTELTIPTSVETIGTDILKGCSSLQTLIIPFIGRSRTDNNTKTSVLGYFFGESTTGVTQQYSVNGTAIYGIPSSLKAITVNDANFIPYGAFSNCSNLTSITLSNTTGTTNTLTTINDKVLQGCTGLREFTFVETITTVQEGMFEGCSLLVTIYNLQNLNLTKLPNNFFKDCTSLTTFTLPSTLTTIGNNVCENCYSLPNIVLPTSIQTIGDYVFLNCNSITNLTIPTSVETIGIGILKGCSNLHTLTVPFIGSNRIDNETRTSVLGYFFGEGEQGTRYTYSYTKNGETINVEIPVVEQEYASGNVAYYFIPSSLTTITVNDANFIPYGAFSNCVNLTSITLSNTTGTTNTLTIINDKVLQGCTGLREFTFVDTITTVQEGMFEGCSSLTTINNLENTQITTIPNKFFKDCTSLTTFTLPNTLTTVGNNVFENCNSLTELTIPTSVETIGTEMLKGCTSLQTLTVPFIGSSRTDNETRTSVLGYFFGESTTGVTQQYSANGTATYGIPSSLTTITVNDANLIPYGAFSNCSNLTSITLSDTTGTIGNKVFENCSSLGYLTIPTSVETIGTEILKGCSELYRLTVPFIGSNRTDNETRTSVLGYFFGESTTGVTQQYSVNGTATYGIPSRLKAITINDANFIPYGAFSNCENITSISIYNYRDSGIIIYNWAFSNSGLNSVYLNNVSTLGEYVFFNTNLTKINLPMSLKILNDKTFEGMPLLEKFTIDEGNNYFTVKYDCLYNNSITSLIKVPQNYQSNIVDVYYGTETIYDNAIKQLKNKKILYIPDSVTSLGSNSLLGTSIMFIRNDSNNIVNSITLEQALYFNYTSEKKDILKERGIYTEDLDIACYDVSYNWEYYENTVTKYNGNNTYVIVPNKLIKNDQLIDISGIGSSQTNDVFNNSVTKINLLKIKNIYELAFSGSSITEVRITSNIEEIDDYAFDKAYELSNIYANTDRYKDVNGILFTKDLKRLIRYPINKNNRFIFSDTIESIGNCAFTDSKVLSIDFKNFNNINAKAIKGCTNLEYININQDLNTSISLSYNFYYKYQSISYLQNKGLYSKYPGAISNIEAIWNFDINSKTINKYIGIGRQTVYIPSHIYTDSVLNKVTNLGSSLFNNELVEEVDFRYSLIVSISSNVFNGETTIIRIYLSNLINSIDESAFNECKSLKEIKVIGDNSTYIDVDGVLFSNNKSKLIRCPINWSKNFSLISELVKNISYLGSYAFSDCINSGFEEFIFNKNLTVGSSNALNNLKYLNKITYNGTSSLNISISFNNINNKNWFYKNGDNYEDALVFSKNGLYTTSNEDFWNFEFKQMKKYLTKYVGPDTIVNLVAPKAYGICRNSNGDMILPNTIESIDLSNISVVSDNAFMNQTSLINVILPSDSSGIGKDILKGCKNINNLSIGSGSNSLRDVTLGYYFGEGSGSYNGIVAVRQEVYSSGSYSQKYYYIPSSLKTVTYSGNELCYGAFSNCQYLENINLTSINLSTIGDYAFYNDLKLNNIEISSNNFKLIDGCLYKINGNEIILYKLLYTYTGYIETIKINNLIDNNEKNISLITLNLYNNSIANSDALHALEKSDIRDEPTIFDYVKINKLCAGYDQIIQDATVISIFNDYGNDYTLNKLLFFRYNINLGIIDSINNAKNLFNNIQKTFDFDRSVLLSEKTSNLSNYGVYFTGRILNQIFESEIAISKGNTRYKNINSYWIYDTRKNISNEDKLYIVKFIDTKFNRGFLTVPTTVYDINLGENISGFYGIDTYETTESDSLATIFGKFEYATFGVSNKDELDSLILKKITIPEGFVELRGYGLIGMVSLVTLEIPASVTYIFSSNIGGFLRTSWLAGVTESGEVGTTFKDKISHFTTIIVDSNNTTYKVEDGLLYQKMSDGNNILIKVPEAYDRSEVTISVRKISAGAFNSSLYVKTVIFTALSIECDGILNNFSSIETVKFNTRASNIKMKLYFEGGSLFKTTLLKYIYVGNAISTDELIVSRQISNNLYYYSSSNANLNPNTISWGNSINNSSDDYILKNKGWYYFEFDQEV